VTFSPNLTMSGYNSWLTTCAQWRRIVDLMRKPAVARLDWCQGGIRRLGLRDRDDWHDRAGRVPSLQSAIPTPSSHKAPIANSGGAIVARSRILLSGSTATLLGTMTNETGFDVYFSGLPPRVIAFGTDGSERILFGDFSSPPRPQPTCGDWVMHPGAMIPYRSLPVTLENSNTRWDGSDWCTSCVSTTLDIMTFCPQQEVPIVQLVD
jgi:hypothetical protein